MINKLLFFTTTPTALWDMPDGWQTDMTSWMANIFATLWPVVSVVVYIILALVVVAAIVRMLR